MACLPPLPASRPSVRITATATHPPRSPSAPSRAQLPLALRRPIHVAPEAIGVSQQDLVDRILRRARSRTSSCSPRSSARSATTTRSTRCRACSPTRAGRARGDARRVRRIGTEHAVDVLVEHTKDDRPSVRNAAIGALGATQAARAEKILLELVAQERRSRAGGGAVARSARSAPTGRSRRLIEAANSRRLPRSRPRRCTRSARPRRRPRSRRCAS